MCPGSRCPGLLVLPGFHSRDRGSGKRGRRAGVRVAVGSGRDVNCGHGDSSCHHGDSLRHEDSDHGPCWRAG
ncbi:hypothetical protein AMIS_70570 [Actinoplanes missouriensis 431]|uniref:Uncharacterized protein n=1 Tax=Actinoplanes missouriensis (strain ATCC 14538 / DSM 43046 / CBS 188.64 / JCM 3121 / NBRC 102363 / NCIMB 12654 / NRRL B-3342 / UNCC 431) TaxID=512565 RepID=I0HGZ0_ACTM4|nr:hypothetical protein AMIS_70570 [Actinoplanes missouriensis 431]